MRNKSTNVLYILSPVIIHYILSEVLFALIYFGIRKAQVSTPANFLLVLNVLLCCIPIPLFLYMYVKDQKKHAFNLHSGKKLSILAFPGFLIAGAILSQLLNMLLLSSPLPDLFTGYDDSFSRLLKGQISLLFIFWTVLAAPLAEELIFRWLLYKRMRTCYSAIVSILVSAFLFGLFHGNMLQFAFAFLMGLVLAGSLEYTGSVFAPLMIHIGANLWSMLITLLY